MKLSEIIAQETGMPPEHVIGHARIARWTPEVFREQMQREGWPERFHEAIEEGIRRSAEERSSKRLADALHDGPAAMARLSMAERVELVDPRLQNTAESYDPDNESRLLCGPTALGKSMAAVCVIERALRAMIARGLRRNLTGEASYIYETIVTTSVQPILWVRAAALPSARLQAKLGTGEADLVHNAMQADFLVLDDLGWESKRAGADDVIGEVMQARYDAGKPSLTTTGLRYEQAIERYGEAYVRRLVECRGNKGKVVDLWPRA